MHTSENHDSCGMQHVLMSLPDELLCRAVFIRCFSKHVFFNRTGAEYVLQHFIYGMH